MEVSAKTGENVEKLFLAIGELYLLRRFLKLICVCCTKFSIASAHLHQSYNTKSFITACAPSLCAVVLNFNWRWIHVSTRKWFFLLNAIVAPTPAVVIWPQLVRRPGHLLA